jgi:hypothetical protein
VILFVAEGVGFEPTSRCRETVFKTAAFDHSAIPPDELKFLTSATVKGQQLLRPHRPTRLQPLRSAMGFIAEGAIQAVFSGDPRLARIFFESN